MEAVLERYEQSERVLHQRIALLAVVLFPVFGVAYAWVTPNDWDPVGPRIFITLCFALVYAVSRTSDAALKWTAFLLFLADQLLIHWINVLTVVNGVTAPWVLGVFINHYAAAYVFTDLRYNLATHASVGLGVAGIAWFGGGEVGWPLLAAAWATLAIFNMAAVLRRRRTIEALASREEQLRRAREHLEERVRERTRELEREVAERTDAEIRAHAANLAKSQFLATMSHELRTPLNAVIGYTEILQEDLVDADSSVQEDLTRVLGSAEHLLAMINDILDLAKIESGAWEFTREQVDIAALVRGVASTLTPLMESNGNRLTVNLPEDLEPLYTDRVRLTQVLVNLGTNAAKFTEQGEVTLTVRKRGGRFLDFEVADTGCGIAPENLSFIFDKFVQVDPSYTRKHGGTGLGLAICRELATGLGGRIFVESELGRGSTFTVRLAAQGGAASGDSSPGGQSRQVSLG